ncbi:hypothetical protein [Anaeromicropila populeti]|uniref:Uncharacterized protein n=1 Tax=Anaeromicropila populeti TaxID=37658 RepID=A0A1I6HPY4_9FIRM|nr:hypothetical protein [Anaeromicropila populeti]SFR56512.1 hypothetical protein SAMN05661086_00158 [Anaeromicropila populeti]
MELDFEDFVEEVKFQMTEYDRLTEEMILNWEIQAREWVKRNKNKPYLTYKAPDDIIVKIKSEDDMEELARLFYRAVRDDQLERYWKNFKLIV